MADIYENSIDDEEELSEQPVASDPVTGAELFEHFRFVADKGQQLLRVDKFLAARIEKSSRNRIQQAADAGCILVNGKSVKSNYRVKPLDVVSVVMDRPRYEFEVIAQDIPIDIVYEDSVVLVVNKPAGMVVHPGHGNYSGTLVNALAWHMRNIPDYDVNDPRMGLVHRIDKDTSGLLVVAKTPDAKTNLGRQFFNKTTKRQYVALVWGIPQPMQGTVATNIGRSLRDRLQMDTFPLDGDMGKRAVTHYSVEETMNYVSLVKCVLETGRTHQIRVHMKSIGHPLFADARYGGDQILRGLRTQKYSRFVANCHDICPRQALHAQTLGCVHPETGEEMFFSAPIPADMQALIEKWRLYSPVE